MDARDNLEDHEGNELPRPLPTSQVRRKLDERKVKSMDHTLLQMARNNLYSETLIV